jgi:tripartite-type tricarboxylate transporter receptor subunit TctC
MGWPLGKVIAQGLLISGLLAFAAPAPVPAADWPSKQIKLVVPYTAGGGTDALARVLANKLSNDLRQTVIVLNRPGGKSIVAYQAVLDDPADGYTFLFNNSSHAIQAIYSGLPYSPFKDFTPVGAIATGSSVLAVTPSLGVNDLGSFISYVGAHPATLNYGSYGVGTNSHLQGELLNAAAGIDMAHVAYKGSASALNDLVGGHIQALFVDALAALPLVRAKKIVPLAMVGTKRPSSYPELPTFGELGFTDLSSPGWWALFVRAGTAPDIVRSVNAALQRAVADPEVMRQIRDLGADPDAISADVMAQMISTDAVRWKKIVQDRHIEVE